MVAGGSKLTVFPGFTSANHSPSTPEPGSGTCQLTKAEGLDNIEEMICAQFFNYFGEAHPDGAETEAQQWMGLKDHKGLKVQPAD